MLIQFTIGNFKTFKEKATISLLPHTAFKESEAKNENNVFQTGFANISLLKSAVIYGANASGKSKFVEAMDFMKYFIINSAKESQANERIDVEPFRLSIETENEPCFFEIAFIYENALFRYGFEATHQKIHTEWLFYKPKTKEVCIFFREQENLEIHKDYLKVFKELQKLQQGNLILRNNTLLLSFVVQTYNDTLGLKVMNWFNSFNIISGLEDSDYESFTVNKLQHKDSKNKILSLLQLADLGIEDFKAESVQVDSAQTFIPDPIKKMILSKNKDAHIYEGVKTYHTKYDQEGNSLGQEEFSLDDHESKGTQKYFSLSGIILDNLENGEVLVVDELDAKLHPILVQELVKLFNSKDTNPKNAQLIFVTHDVNLLDSDIFRRDQIWFIEKDRYQAAYLYPLTNFSVRDNTDLKKNYIWGKYGAIPFVNFKNFFNNGGNQ